MARIMLHKNILKNFSQLPSKVQKRLSEFIDRFQENPYDPALGLHSVKEIVADSKVHGADLPDGYRAIIIAPEKGDTFLMVHIDKHDAAYEWAKNKRFEVHKMTGVFQIFDVTEVQQNVRVSSQPTKSSEYPLSKMSDKDLFSAGVPEPLIPSIRAITSDADLESLAAYLPPDCRDVLYGIAAGMTLDQALEEMLGSVPDSKMAPESAGDFSDLSDQSNYDLVFVDNENELKDALQASLDEWRIFLHPYQRKLVNMETDGPLCITGAAGTGKTVVLLHRAIQLARRLGKGKEKVLFTTFTTNLPVTLRHYLEKLDRDAAERIEVTSLYALARTLCLRSGWNGTVAGDGEINEIWNNIFADIDIKGLPITIDELKEEYRWVIDPNGIENEEEYLTAIRSDRPRISREQRRHLWTIFNNFQRTIKSRNMLTVEGVIHQARLAVSAGNFDPYTNIIVDEIQDFSLEALRFIHALSSRCEGKNPLTVAGDGHQRVYRKKIPMSRGGIEVRGRSYRLKINYRTSEEIRIYAQGLLEGIDVDDFQGEIVSVAGDHSLFKGPAPLVKPCLVGDEAKEIVSWIEYLKSYGYKPHEICVVPYKGAIHEKLSAAGYHVYRLMDREADPGEKEPGVRMGSMYRIKGLEFKAVALACADKESPVNDLHHASPLDKALLYVAASRARERLLVLIAV